MQRTVIGEHRDVMFHFVWRCTGCYGNFKRYHWEGCHAGTPRGTGQARTAFWHQQVCSWSCTITEETRWRDQSHCHLEQECKECRDVIHHIWERTPTHLRCTGWLALLAPIGQNFYGIHGPYLFATPTNTTLTHGTTNGIPSNIAKLYIPHLVKSSREDPCGWCTGDTSSR